MSGSPPGPVQTGGTIDLNGHIKRGSIEVGAPETPEEHAARLRRAEAEATVERRLRVGSQVLLAGVALAMGFVGVFSPRPEQRQAAMPLALLIFGGFVGYYLGRKER